MVLQKYYDLKTVKADLLTVLKDNTEDSAEKSKLESLLTEGVGTCIAVSGIQ